MVLKRLITQRSALPAAPPSRLAHEAVVTEDEPHPSVRVEPTARSGTRRHPRRPCHKRAVHSSSDRSPADNHGQRQSSIDLRRSPPSQVTIPPDLALGAGSRAVADSLRMGAAHLWSAMCSPTCFQPPLDRHPVRDVTEAPPPCPYLDYLSY